MTFKELRTKKKITQQKISKMLGLDQTTVSKWETGSSKPDIIMTTKLAEVLGVTTDEVIACFVK